MAKGTIGGKYREGYDLDVEIVTTIKDGKPLYELRNIENNKLIKSWRNPDSPRTFARKRQYNVIN